MGNSRTDFEDYCTYLVQFFTINRLIVKIRLVKEKIIKKLQASEYNSGNKTGKSNQPARAPN